MNLSKVIWKERSCRWKVNSELCVHSNKCGLHSGIKSQVIGRKVPDNYNGKFFNWKAEIFLLNWLLLPSIASLPISTQWLTEIQDSPKYVI